MAWGIKVSGEADDALRMLFSSAYPTAMASIDRYFMRVPVDAGERVCRQMRGSPCAIVVSDGILVFSLAYDPLERGCRLRILGPGDAEGFEYLFLRDTCPEGELVALTAAWVLMARCSDLASACDRCHALFRDIGAMVSRDLVAANYRASRIRSEPPIANLALELLILHGRFGGGKAPTYLRTCLSRDMLADLIGVSRESLFRALHTLKEQGLISTHGRSIEILDPEGLHRAAHVDADWLKALSRRSDQA